MKDISKLKRKLITKRIRDIKKELLIIIKKEAINTWLNKPNKAFDGLTPLQLIELGEHRKIYDMIYDVVSGNPS